MTNRDELAKSSRERIDEPSQPASDEASRCDACGLPMKPMGHCKYLCLACGFLRTCNDVI